MILRTIYLHGRLKSEFGPRFRFDVSTAAEAFRALNCAFPGKFIAALQTGYFKVVRGDRRNGMSLDIDLISSFGLGAADLHIIPVAKGAANGKASGTMKAVIGTAIIGGAIFMSGGTLAAPLASLGSPIATGLGITWGNIAAIGLGVTLMGASQLLAKPDTPKADDNSFTTSGPGNTATQGSPIPLIYGRVVTSPVTISVDADIEDIGAYQGVVGPLG